MARKVAVVLLALLLFVSLAACAQKPSETAPAAGADGGQAAPAEQPAAEPAAGRKVAVLTPYLASVTTAEMVAALEEEGKARGWKVTVVDTKGDFGALASRFEDVIAQKVDAIVLGMADPNQLTEQVAAAVAAGIPVLGGDAGFIDGMAINVTSDNAAMSRQMSQYLLDAIGGKGKIVVLTHRPHAGVRARTEALDELRKSYPDVQVLQEFHVDVPGPLENARKTVENVLTANPEPGSIAGVWAGWDEPAIGAVQAMQAAGRAEIKVVGIDGTSQAIDMIKQGSPLIATVSQDFKAMAAILAEQLDRLFQGQGAESPTMYAPSHLLTRETLGN